MAVMRTALPETFRLRGPADDTEAHALREEMEAQLVAPLLAHASEALQPPQALPWYPQRLARQFDVWRAALRGRVATAPSSSELGLLEGLKPCPSLCLGPALEGPRSPSSSSSSTLGEVDVGLGCGLAAMALSAGRRLAGGD